jgi:hypothetical protein
MVPVVGTDDDDGSLAGGKAFLVTERGDTGAALGLKLRFFDPVILFAIFRKGDIDPDRDRLPVLDIRETRGALGGVAKNPFLEDAVPEFDES